MPESYTGDEGTAAFAAGLDILDGTEKKRNGWLAINKTRDYIVERIAAVFQEVWSIAKGGTGATTQAGALQNLGALPRAEVFDGTGSVFNKVPRYDGQGRLICAAPQADNHAAPLGWLNQVFASYIPRWGGTIDQGTLVIGGAGQLSITNATQVTNGFAALYRNADGRVGISPSARRFKKDIKPHTYTLEQLRAVRVVSYRLKASVYGDGWEDAPVDVGVIAEELIDAGLAEFVVFDDEGQPLSVHYERLALVAIGALQDLADRVDRLEQKIEAQP